MTRAALSRVFQVPEGYVVILKNVIVSDETGGPGFIWNLSFADRDINHYVYVHLQQDPVHVDELELWSCLNPGDYISIYCDPAPVRYWIAGAMLPAPPYELPLST